MELRWLRWREVFEYRRKDNLAVRDAGNERAAFRILSESQGLFFDHRVFEDRLTRRRGVAKKTEVPAIHFASSRKNCLTLRNYLALEG